MGGLITGNPWLAKGEASVILNEVNSANPSQLNGFVEVAGKRADVIIANPAGITCSGCGFINANKTTLAAAQVLLEQGKIAGFDVKNGQIAIQGNGLNDTQSDYTQLIARAVKINAKLHAKDLSVTTGKNRTDANGKVLSTEATSDTAPEFAIDVASLGGMYANKIRLVGTEKGVGVRNAGELGAAVGDVVLSVDGRIRNAGVITANQHIDIHSQASIENQGTLLTKSDIQLQAKEAITNTQQGQIVSGRDTRLNANTLQSDNTALLAAGINEKGQLTASGSLTLNAEQSADLHGEVVAKDTLTVTGKTLNLSHANVQAANLHLTASAGDIRTQNGRFLATENATLKAQQQIDNQDGEIAAKNLTLEAQGAMTNTNGRLIATQELTLNSQQLNNAQGVLSSGTHLTVKTGEIDNRQGLISGKSVAIDTQGQQFINQSSQAGQGIFAENSLHLKVGALMNQQGHIQGQHITLDTQQNQIDNTEGEILSTETLNITAGELNNLRGLVQAGKHLTLDTQGRAINNQQTQQSGGLLSGGDLTVNSGEFNNQQGQVQGGGDTTLTTAQWNNQQGQLLSGGSLQVNTQQRTFLNQSGTVASHGTLDIRVADLDNTQGHLQGNSGIELQAKQINNTAGTLLSQGALNLEVDALDNQQGTIQSQGRATLLVAQDINNNQGKIRSGDNLNIRAQSVNNTQGQLQGVGDVTLTLLHHLNNTAGWVKANQTLTLSSQTVDNTQTGQAGLGLEGQNVTLTAAALDNQQGAIRAGASLQANVHQTLNNTDGLLSAGEALTVTDNAQGAGLTLTNTDGVIVSNGEASIIANQLRGEGKLLAQSNLALLIQQAFVNRGRIQAGEKLHIQVAEGLTNLGLISSLGELQLLATNVDNAASGEISGNQTHITVKEAINNTGLIDGQLTHLIGQSLNNVGTGRIYGDIIAIAVKSLINDKQEGQSAVIAGRQSVNIAVSDLLNRDHALIYSDGDLVIGGALDENLNATGRADNVKNHSANIEAAGNLTLKTTTLENKDIHLELTQDAIEVSREHFDWFDIGNGNRYKMQPRNGNQTRYAINEDGSLNKEVGIHYEDSSRWRMFEYGNWTKNFYEYDYDRIVYETQIIQQDAALITSGKNLTLDGQSLLNENAKVIAGQNLILTADALNNQETQGTRRVFDDGLTLYRYKCSGDWYTCTSRSTYQGLNTSENLALNLMEATENAGSITQIQLDAVKENALDQQAGEVEGSEFNAQPGLDIAEQTLKGTQDVVIKTVGPNITLPDNSLFTLTPNSDSQYLIETDPRFTNNKKWLSSLDILDSNQLHKRLGDGYYEQKLVRDQLIETTGQRLLGQYDSDEAQYRALLTNGAAFGEKYHLTPGIALSAEQMANLTTDIVWMVNKEITLPDGTIELVSVPQVYVRAREGDLNGNGALLAGKNVAADITGNILNSGEISSRALTEIRADDIQNSGQLQGHDITQNALKDIKNIGGEIRGTNSVSLSAGRDILSETAQRQEGNSSWLDRPASIYVTGDNGELTLKAVQNVNIIASTVASTGENGKAAIIAGKDINLDTREVSTSFDYTHNANNYYRGETSTEVGTQIYTNGDLTLSAGQDINAKAAQVRSDSTLNVNAGRDVNITSGIESSDYVKHTKHTDKGFLSSATTETHDEISDRTALGSTFSGDSVNINAGHDMNVQGSNILGTNDVTVNAGNQLNIGTSDEAHHETHMSKTTKSGIMSSGGLGFTVGKQSVKQTTDTDSNQKKGSVIGSTAGNVTLSAGNTATIHSSDVIAAKDIHVTASDINITAAENTRTDVTTTETKSSGLSVSLGGAVGSALNTAYQTGKAAQETDDGQLKALQGIKAGLKLQQANQAGQLAAAQQPGSDMTNNGSFGIDVSYGSSSSKSTSKTEQNTASGSSLTAGDNLTLNATGKAADSQGNINVQGSTLNADKDLTLNAKNDINLSSATNTQTVDSKNESKGTTVGVGISAGTGWNVNASVSKGSGFEKGNSQYYTDTKVNAGKTLTINSGNDTTLTGAQASGNTVKMNVGGDLTLSSQQVTDKYDSKQTNSSVGGSYSQGGGVSANISADKSEMHSDYQSVDNQTGIHAGQGGFDITVGDHTQLDGAVISSDANKDKNRLDTGTIGFNDIENKADYTVEQQSGGYNTGGDIGGKLISNAGSALLAGVNNKGKDSNTTQSAVAEGDIIVRDTDNQTQNVDDLSRDTANAHEKLGTIFDKDEEQKRIDRNQLIGEIGQQIKDIAVTDARINATQNVLKNNPELKGDDLEAAIQAEINQSKWGVGGENTRIVDAGTALIQGLANGDVNAAVANASAPYIANYIAKEIGKDNKAGLLAAHAIANVALALAKDENALSQAAGAVTAEAMGMLSQEIYKKDVSQLTEEEKSTLSAFASLAAGIAGGLVGGETQDALNAAQAGKTTVENNALGEIVDQLVTGKSQEEKYEDAKKQLKQLTDEFKQKNCAGLSADACSAKMVEHRNELLMGATDFGIDFIPIVGDIKGFAEAQSAIDYLAATVGLIPVLGDSAGKYIKLADKALKEGDIAEASRLINKASDEIVGQLPTPGNVSLPSTGLGSNAKFSVTNEQLGKKLGKHVEDFGGNPSNASDRQYVLDIINDIGSKPDKVIAGKFAGQGIGVGASRGDVFFRIKGNDVVVTKPDGSFVTVLKDGVTNNTSVKNALKGNPQ
ncbi:hemagglutinin repeat-containing protein [Providencia rettgeri]